MEIAVKSLPSGSEAFTLSLLLSVFNLADAVSDYFGALLYDSYTASFFFHLVWINAAGTAATALIVPSLMRWIGSK
jgi:6-phosphogluconate dehydrogenase